jgi:PAS domain S-box-containing protein
MSDRLNEQNGTDFFQSKDAFQLFRSAISHAPVAISITRKTGEHLYHNDRFKEMFGYPVEEMTPARFRSLFVDPDVFDHVIKTLEIEVSWSGEVEMMHRSGRVISVVLNAEAVADENGKTQTYIGTYTDISEQKEKGQIIRYQNEYLSTFHSISLGMFRRLNLSDLLNAIITRASRITDIPNGFLHIYDPDEGILEMKAACGNLTGSIGYQIKPDIGIGGAVFQTGEPLIIDNYQKWSQGIKDPMFERIYSIVGIPLASGTRIEGVIGLSHHEPDMAIGPEIIPILEEFSAIAQMAIDNAKLFEKQKQELERRIELEKERKEIELRLQQSQKMESIGTLAGGISHDFNNILSSIMGYTQIAMADQPKDSQLYSDLNEIYAASLRARDLVRQILTFARQTDADSVSPLKISLIAKEVLKFIRSSIPATIQIHQKIISPSKVLADPTQIYQIFLNLLTNASQAMEENGGLLSVNIVDEQVSEDRQSLSKGKYIKIIVSDTGVGIAPENVSKIFDPYFTTKAVGEGTGLGLAVVHGSVVKMDGEIFVDSEPGKGTTFCIYLPVAKEDSEPIVEDAFYEDLPLGNQEHVLVVDDEQGIVIIQKRMLERFNYSVEAFTSSVDALAAFKAEPDRFSAVLTDMTMPGMTGDQLVRAVRKVKPDIAVILCTGLSQYLNPTALEKEGIDYFCRKPVIKSELIRVVRAAIDGTQMDEISHFE